MDVGVGVNLGVSLGAVLDVRLGRGRVANRFSNCSLDIF